MLKKNANNKVAVFDNKQVLSSIYHINDACRTCLCEWNSRVPEKVLWKFFLSKKQIGKFAALKEFNTKEEQFSCYYI